MTAGTASGLDSPRRIDWRERAACAIPTRYPEWWEQVGQSLTEANRAAIRICLMCPVRLDCLTEGVRAANPGVILGGFTDRERADYYAESPDVRTWPQPDPNLADRQCDDCGERFTPSARFAKVCPDCRARISHEAALRRAAMRRAKAVAS